MTADLMRLWAVRDEAKARWQAFTAEATPEDDPVLLAMDTPEGSRTAEQQAVLDEFAERHHTLLEAIHAAERAVRVASGHEKP